MKAIIACDKFGGIGYQGRLPWPNLPGDLPRFKALTTECTVVMGRNTWGSLPKKPLPNRTNIVFSRTDLELPHDVAQVRDLTDLAQFKDAWFIGGARLFPHVWPYINEVHLSRIERAYTCDRYVDLLHLSNNYFKVNSTFCEGYVYEEWKR